MTRVKRIRLREGFGAGAETDYQVGGHAGFEMQWYEPIGVVAIWRGAELWHVVPMGNIKVLELAEVPKGFAPPEPKKGA
jgi:hypothetical protein